MRIDPGVPASNLRNSADSAESEDEEAFADDPPTWVIAGLDPAKTQRMRAGAPAEARLRRLAFSAGREAAVEGVALGGHLDEQLGRLEAVAVLLLQRLAQLDEALGAHH